MGVNGQAPHAEALDKTHIAETPVELYQRLTEGSERLPILDDVQVTIVNTREKAREVLAKLKELKTVHACDTEVADLDVKAQGPVGNGKVSPTEMQKCTFVRS